MGRLHSGATYPLADYAGSLIGATASVLDRIMAISIELNAIGRLRAKDVIGLLRVSKSTFYQGIKTGRYPKPDGRDGGMVYWRVETLRAYLSGGVQ